MLAVISYVLFIYVGIRKHGFGKYIKNALIPPAPWFILPLLIPIEFFSTFIVRPFTLAAPALRQHVRRPHDPAGLHARRLRAAQRERAASRRSRVLSWVMAIALTFLEALVVVLQAYVFVVLTASYVQGALAEEH